MTLRSTPFEAGLEEQPDPFDALETPAEIMGFIHKRYGPEGLKQLLLTRDSDNVPISREIALAAAQELAQVGLKTAATIVTEVAQELPSMTDVETYCPYLQEPYSNDRIGQQTNVRCWQASQQRRQRGYGLKQSVVSTFKK